MPETNKPDTLTSNEGEERLKQIREGLARVRRDPSLANPGFAPPLWDDIEFLLSLIDSQAVSETFVGPCVSCGHNNYDVERGERVQHWVEGRMSVACGCPCARRNSIANTATEMRNKCVEKVREIHEERLRGLRALTEKGEVEQEDATLTNLLSG